LVRSAIRSLRNTMWRIESYDGNGREVSKDGGSLRTTIVLTIRLIVSSRAIHNLSNIFADLHDRLGVSTPTHNTLLANAQKRSISEALADRTQLPSASSSVSFYSTPIEWCTQHTELLPM
jgi:hypothetical protein